MGSCVFLDDTHVCAGFEQGREMQPSFALVFLLDLVHLRIPPDHTNSLLLRNQLDPVLRKYRVNLVLVGHQVGDGRQRSQYANCVK